jgi:hypothetical protein
MKAKLVFHTKTVNGDEIVEIKIWQMPKSLNRPHGIKFSVVYVKRGKRLVGYDNAEQEGYHRHFLDKEEPYAFVSIWKLLDDFRNDVETLRGGRWDEN